MNGLSNYIGVMILRGGIVITVILLFALLASAGVRDIDFREFSYPWDNSEEDSPYASEALPRTSGDMWAWIGKISQSEVRLENGRHSFTEPGLSLEDAPYLMFQSVTYGDLDGDGKEEAAVQLHYGTGGTQTWEYLYIYGLNSDSPKLLGILVGGSRADGGLVKVAIEKGLLVLDFNDSSKQQGDCCSSGFVRVNYRLLNGRFAETGDRYYADYNASPTDPYGRPHPAEIRNTADVKHYEAALQADSENIEARKMLLNWYLGHLDDPATASVRLQHVLWTIEHHPDLPLVDYLDSPLFYSSRLESAVLLIDERERDSFLRVRQAWLDQVKNRPSNTIVLYRAAIALSRSDPQLAAEWFKQVIRTETGSRASIARQLLGRLYSDAVMGVVARTPLQVPGPVDQASSKSNIAQFAKSEVEHSRDAPVVGEAGSWLHETSRILGITRTGYDPLSVEWLKVAAEWLKRAEALDNTEELIEMYETDLYRDVSSKIIPPEPIRIKLSTDEAPRPSKTVEASCPAGSTALSQSAGIDVRLIIATDGQVRFALRKGLNIQEIQRRETAGISLKTPPVLLKSALDAARQYRFPLTYRNGNAVEVETTITVAVCK